uniref:Putative BPI/LBP family protein At1g04970 n=1 Tax=Tanacetum cinerariifolium TaxID=118510 RepID=A0A699JKS9_TANCI|nr:putative BPI/LBP family protein At1g04970 [Tanacetum cinerariifolium]
MINSAISNLIPLNLPDIEQTVQIPLVGKVKMVVSNIVIYNVQVARSFVQSGDLGLTIVASGATADLRFDWSYKYSTWFFDISDSGVASVKVLAIVLSFSTFGSTDVEKRGEILSPPFRDIFFVYNATPFFILDIFNVSYIPSSPLSGFSNPVYIVRPLY